MREYLVELNYTFDPYVASFLYYQGIIVVSGDIGDTQIRIQTNLSKEEILNKCEFDIKRIIE